MELNGKRAAVLVEQQYQEMEIWYPVYRLREAGCSVTLVGPEAGQTYPSKLGYPARSDKSIKDVSADPAYRARSPRSMSSPRSPGGGWIAIASWRSREWDTSDC